MSGASNLGINSNHLSVGVSRQSDLEDGGGGKVVLSAKAKKTIKIKVRQLFIGIFKGGAPAILNVFRLPLSYL